jgi:hypothetical protein
MVQKTISIIPIERVQNCIYLIRRHKVMLSQDLATLYGVEPRTLIQAVKRNIHRFPNDFMFQLNQEEFENLKSQIVISSWGGIRRATPYAFTVQGVAMLSSVLRSKRAIEVNIAIMRTFVKLREILTTNVSLRLKIDAMERKYNEQFNLVFKILSEMTTPARRAKTQIGYLTEAQDHKESPPKSSKSIRYLKSK